jgi:hypothetical protein
MARISEAEETPDLLPGLRALLPKVVPFTIPEGDPRVELRGEKGLMAGQSIAKHTLICPYEVRGRLPPLTARISGFSPRDHRRDQCPQKLTAEHVVDWQGRVMLEDELESHHTEACTTWCGHERYIMEMAERRGSNLIVSAYGGDGNDSM